MPKTKKTRRLKSKTLSARRTSSAGRTSSGGRSSSAGRTSTAGRTSPGGRSSSAGRTSPGGRSSSAGRTSTAGRTSPGGRSLSAGRTSPGGRSSPGGSSSVGRSSSGGRKALSAGRGDDADSEYRNITMTSKATSKWVLPSGDTMKAVTDCINVNIQNVLGSVDLDICTDVDNMLKQLKQVLVACISKMKVPRAKMKNYLLIQQLVRNSEELINSNLFKADDVDAELEKVKKLLEELEDEKEQLEGKLGEISEEDRKVSVTHDSGDNKLFVESLVCVITSMMAAEAGE